MEAIKTSALMVKCPHCGNRFTPEDGVVRGIAGGAVQEIKALELQEYVLSEL